MCYVYRVTQEDHFDQDMFQFTQTQESMLDQVCRAVAARIEYLAVPSSGAAANGSEDQDDDPARTRLENDIDKWILSFYVALIQHRTKERAFKVLLYHVVLCCSLTQYDYGRMAQRESMCQHSQPADLLLSTGRLGVVDGAKNSHWKSESAAVSVIDFEYAHADRSRSHFQFVECTARH